ncbi:MAG: MFS transporter [Candidatus Binataceae bacterium]
MAIESSEFKDTSPPDSPAAAPQRIYAYFTILTLALGLGAPSGLAAIPIGYFLKDHLHLSPLSLAAFIALAGIPAYLGFLFGFLRDRWRPPVWGDRGYLLIGSVLAAGMYLWLSEARLTYSELLAVLLLDGVAYMMITASTQALMTGVAQAHSMTGRLSVVFLFGYFVPAVIAALLGGWLVANVSERGTLVIAACVTIVIALQAFWRLDAVEAFDRFEDSSREGGFAAIARLIAHPPIWPAALIYFLWNFGPGWGTPMFYHLTETVKISSKLFGTFTAVQWAFFLPTTILYGVVCRRVPLSRLLWWGTIVAIAQGPIMFFAQSAASAMVVAVLYGLFGGFATAAYMDLVMRSCPKGLEGTGVMLATSAFAIASSSGNLLGSWIYATGGFASAVIITTLATALIVPVLWWVPKNITATREGEVLALEPS